MAAVLDEVGKSKIVKKTEEEVFEDEQEDDVEDGSTVTKKRRKRRKKKTQTNSKLTILNLFNLCPMISCLICS